MTAAVSGEEARLRRARRLATRAFDTYERSSVGGFLYLIAWLPLLAVTGLAARERWLASSATLAFLAAAILRKRFRPPPGPMQAQARWINAYVAVALSSTAIWSCMQWWVISDVAVAPLVKAASLFGTIAFSTVMAHLYTSVLRMSVTGIAVLIVPAVIALGLDPELHVLAVTLVFYTGYLATAALRSHREYMRRLDLDEALRDQRDRYEHLSRTDPLTGLCNRRTFTETLSAQVREAQWLSGAGVALALLDIDYFKAINDLHGHLMGDEVLRQLAGRLELAFEGGDFLVSRTGGEEFGLILRDCDEVSAMLRVEKFRAALGAQPLECDGIEVPVTVSIGVGSFNRARHRSDDDLYGDVDIALYAAKLQGRNRVVSVSMLSQDSVADTGTERLGRLTQIRMEGDA